MEIPNAQSKLLKGISNFSCAKNPEVENFLKEQAINFNLILKSRTYLLIDTDRLPDEFAILGYFTLSITTMDIPDNMSNTQIAKLDGISAKIHKKLITALPAYLIGQLAKNDIYHDDVQGSELIKAALTVIRQSAEKVGGRLVMMDCEPKPQLHAFYSRNGFLPIGHDDITGLDQFLYPLNYNRLQNNKIKSFNNI